MDSASFWVFLAAITLLTISPGVDTVLVIRNASRGGLPDGLVTTVSICTGLFVHATVSAVGISVILLQSAILFGVLKLVGAVYLIWLGVTSIRQSFKADVIPDVLIEGHRPFILSRSIREGLLSNLLNPKTIVFYMAFLPQFIDPAQSALLQSLWLAFIHFVISVVWLGLVALMVTKVRIWLTDPLVKRSMDGIVGGLLTLFGLGLAWETLRR